MHDRTEPRAGCAERLVLDGYPRTLAQARHVDQASAGLDVVVQLVAPRERLRRRLLPRERRDDTADVIGHRLEVDAELTAPLLETFADGARLVLIDGTGTIDRVGRRIGRELRVLAPATADRWLRKRTGRLAVPVAGLATSSSAQPPASRPT